MAAALGAVAGIRRDVRRGGDHVSGLNHGVQYGFGPFSWAAQAAALIALAAALTPLSPAPGAVARRRPAAAAEPARPRRPGGGAGGGTPMTTLGSAPGQPRRAGGAAARRDRGAGPLPGQPAEPSLVQLETR